MYAVIVSGGKQYQVSEGQSVMAAQSADASAAMRAWRMP